MGILMIVVGAKFVTVNGHQVPVAWSIAGLMLIGAIITSEMHHNKPVCTMMVTSFLFPVFIKPDLRKTNIDRRKNQLAINNKPPK